MYGMEGKQLTLLILKAVIVLCIVSYLFYKNFLLAIIFCPGIHIYLKQKSMENEQIKKKEINNQFKDGMIAVSFALNVGYSIENSFREALEELILLYGSNSIIVNEFRTIVKRVGLNENIEEVIADFAARSEVEDIIYFSEVFKYAKRSGGDLIAIIKSTARTISEKAEVKREIDTIISGKQMEQKVMSVIPFGIILYLKLTSPEFIEPLYNNLAGFITMTVCLIMYMVSYLIAKRIVRIEV